MRKLGTQLVLSATDLANYPGCAHLTTLDRSVTEGERKRPHYQDPTAETLAARGAEHEANYLAQLKAQGRRVLELHSPGGPPSLANYEAAVAETKAALASGVDIICQPTLFDGTLLGRADFLVRVETPSELGGYAYEIHDTKLSSHTKAASILQLCCYAELLAQLQGVLPEHVWVVPGGEGQAPESYRVVEYLSYYRVVKRRFLEHVSASQAANTYPEPCSHCEVCVWYLDCERQLRADDHLSLVANLARFHRNELEDRDIHTVETLAAMPIPIDPRPKRGSVETYTRVREQARVQVEGRNTGRPIYEFLEPEPARGLAMLPEPSPGDLFFDIEGDRYAPGGGLEYLFGLIFPHEKGREPEFRALWAFTRAEEKRQFEALIDLIMARREEHPGMHVFHYAPYEPTAMKRLMGTYGTREQEVDTLLREHVFVDLYSVVRQGIRASVESYSIKRLEPFYDYERDVPLEGVGRLMRQFEVDLELGRADEVDPEVRDTIEGYNRDDCVSTLRLRDWLEKLREELLGTGAEVLRPIPTEPTQAVVDDTEVQALYDALVADLPPLDEELTDPQRARWLMANLLMWHRREKKSMWWEVFHRCSLTDIELTEERSCLGGLEYLGPIKIKRSTRHRYRFPLQEHDFGRAKEAITPEPGNERLKVVDVDDSTRTITLTAPKEQAPADLTAVVPVTDFRDGVLRDSLFRLGTAVEQHGLHASAGAATEFLAARRLLLAEPPHVTGHAGGPLRREGEATLDAAKRLARTLDHSVLPIQGPPGSGKTYTGARMIVELVRTGLRVGVTANSHKVIRNLLNKTLEAAQEAEVPLRAVQKIASHADINPESPVVELKNNKHVDRAMAADEIDVLAGTAWLWAREELKQQFDVLFIDEAGQLSLANALAVAQAAKSLVLLGDPQQLDQPLQGSHPEGADASALQHLLGPNATMEPERGLFLDSTYRLHPDICRFTSELFYEGRLQALAGLEHQRVNGPDALFGAGLRYQPVAHAGNQNTSPEEVHAVVDIVQRLLAEGVTWTDRLGNTQRLVRDDILIVAPYNAQVSALAEALPESRIGTVDKFQGQEAPVVIYSMTSSSPADAPRGMEFLYSRNRFNVATSRAQCLCVLVASPALLEPECRTPRHLKLANVVAGFVERSL